MEPAGQDDQAVRATFLPKVHIDALVTAALRWGSRTVSATTYWLTQAAIRRLPGWDDAPWIIEDRDLFLAG